MVSEAWMPKNLEIQQRISSNYRHGNIIKLPSHEKVEILTFIGKTKNSINRGPDKSEVYENRKRNKMMKTQEFLSLERLVMVDLISGWNCVTAKQEIISENDL